jgi:hypothetical protein
MFKISYQTVAIIVIALIGFVFAMRVISPEDNWICSKGAWVKHGNPTTLKPTSKCP